MNEAELREKLEKGLERYKEYRERVDNETQYPESETEKDIVDSLLDLYSENERVARLDELGRIPTRLEPLGSKHFWYTLNEYMARLSELSNTHKTGEEI